MELEIYPEDEAWVSQDLLATPPFSKQAPNSLNILRLYR